jgi:hypothetical protein
VNRLEKSLFIIGARKNHRQENRRDFFQFPLIGYFKVIVLSKAEGPVFDGTPAEM